MKDFCGLVMWLVEYHPIMSFFMLLTISSIRLFTIERKERKEDR